MPRTPPPAVLIRELTIDETAAGEAFVGWRAGVRSLRSVANKQPTSASRPR